MCDRSFLWRETKTCHSCNRSLSKLSPNRVRLHFLWLHPYASPKHRFLCKTSDIVTFIIVSADRQIKRYAQRTAKILMKIRTKLVRIASQEHAYNTANGNARLYEPFERRPDSRNRLRAGALKA